MPQTVNFYKEKEGFKTGEIYKKHKKLLFLARDKKSYEYAEKYFNGCKILLYPDIVTSLIGTRSYEGERNGVLLCVRNDGKSFILKSKLGSEYIDSVRADLEAGSKYYTKTDLLPDETLDLESFFSSRHSIRTYLQEPVKEENIREAVKIANRAPSACNRQASYVYFSNSKETVEKIDSLITGSSGFKGEVPNYIIVTTDRAAYFSDVEQFQWYINGGLYLSYLSLALHSQGIGHCIMQWKAFYKTEDDLKALMGISKSEAIIAVVGCGYYPEEVRCIDAQRKGVEDTLHIIQ